MLRTRHTWRRRLMSRLAVGAMTAGLAGALAPPAAADPTCSFNLLNRTMLVEVQGDPEPTDEGLATIQRGGLLNLFIYVSGVSCQGATVLNTDTIMVTGDAMGLPGHESVVLQPGLASADILVEVDLLEQPTATPQLVRLVGTDGPDVMTVGDLGADQDGDGDVDVMITETAAWFLTTLAGDDVVTGQAGTGEPTERRMLIDGGAGDDTLTGGSFVTDAVWGGPGDDILNGGEGVADQVRYDNAPGPVEVIHPAAGSATGSDGTDTLVGFESVIGSAFDDVLVGDDGNNGFDGLGGCDTVDGGAGRDRVAYNNQPGPVEVDLRFQSASTPDCEETFNDIEGAIGSNFDDTLIGDDRNNSLSGVGGIDVIIGLDGDDSLIGGDGNDGISGGPGDDNIQPGAGDDIAHGGSGVDLLSYADVGAGVEVNLLDKTTSLAAGSDSVAAFENVQGSQFNDTLTGDQGPNVLWGLGGDDALDGGDGDDICDPSPGNDPPPVNCEG